MKLASGRPLKKPGYNRENKIQNLIQSAVKLAVEPFDDNERSPGLPTLTEIADAMETTLLRVRKLLITADFFTSPTSRAVQELDGEGWSIPQIMEKLDLGQASVYSYLPYKKGAYNLPDPTLFSEQGKRYRERKKVIAELKAHRGMQDESLWLWKAVIAFEGYVFQTSGRGKDKIGATKFKYEISREAGASGRHYHGIGISGFGNEMWIITQTGKKGKSISRSTVDLAYKKALQRMENDGQVKGPKALGIPGAGSYLYPILIRFGVIASE